MITTKKKEIRKTARKKKKKKDEEEKKKEEDEKKKEEEDEEKKEEEDEEKKDDEEDRTPDLIVTPTPTINPTGQPTTLPTEDPTISPSASPTASTSPSTSPSLSTTPSASPTLSSRPSATPSAAPSEVPTTEPSNIPSLPPSPSPSSSPSASPTQQQLFTRIIPTFSVRASFMSNPKSFPSFSTKRLEILTSKYIKDVFSDEFGENHVAQVTLAFTEVNKRRILQADEDDLYTLTYQVYGVAQFVNKMIGDMTIYSLLQESVDTDSATDYVLKEQNDAYFLPFLQSLVELDISWSAISDSEMDARSNEGTPVAPLTIEEEDGGLGSTFIAMILGGSVAIVAGLLLFAVYYFWSERRYNAQTNNFHDKTIKKTKKSESSNTSGDVPIDIILLKDVDRPSVDAWKTDMSGCQIADSSPSSKVSNILTSSPGQSIRNTFTPVFQPSEMASIEDTASRYQFTNRSGGVSSSNASSIVSESDTRDEKAFHDILDSIRDVPLETVMLQKSIPNSPAASSEMCYPIGDVQLASHAGDTSACTASCAASLPSVEEIKTKHSIDLGTAGDTAKAASLLPPSLARNQSVGDISAVSSQSASSANSFSLSSMLSKRSAAFLSTGTVKQSELRSSLGQASTVSDSGKGNGASKLVKKVKDSLGLKNNEVFTSDMPRILDEGASSISGSADDQLFFPEQDEGVSGGMFM